MSCFWFHHIEFLYFKSFYENKLPISSLKLFIYSCLSVNKINKQNIDWEAATLQTVFKADLTSLLSYFLAHVEI